MTYLPPANGGRINATIGGNTAGAGALISSGTMTLAGGSNVTLSQNANAITVNGPNFSATGAVSLSSSGNTISIGAPAFSAGMSTIGNTAGTTGLVSNQLVFAAGNNVTLSQSTAPGGNTITINGPSKVLSRWEYPEDSFGPIGTLPNASLSVQHMYVPFNVTASAAKIGASVTAAVNGLGGTNATGNVSLWMGLYTQTGSTLSLASSGSTVNIFTWNAAAASGVTGVSGMRQLTVPMNVNMSAGEYWIAAGASSATTGSGMTISLYGNSNYPTAATGMVLAPMGSNTSVGRDVLLWQGIYSANVSAGPTSILNADINNTSASNPVRAAFYHVLYNATY